MHSTAMLVIPANDLDEAIEQYLQLGFRLDAIGPADKPTWAELSMAETAILVDALRLESDGPVVRLASTANGNSWLPPGVELAQAYDDATVFEPIQASVVSHESGGGWNVGRAGMRYRDLIPERHGGAFVASHINVRVGGPVPDYVHYHDVDFQMIFCHRGWVKVVYEDQGPPFVMEAGEGVLQPPGIRHRVLESSDDLYVVELTAPAVHRTNIDHAMTLPTDRIDRHRLFGSQQFARDQAADTNWAPTAFDGYEEMISEIGVATNGVAQVRLLKATPGIDSGLPLEHRGRLRFLFVLSGWCSVASAEGETVQLVEGSSVTVAAGDAVSLSVAAAGTELLDVLVH